MLKRGSYYMHERGMDVCVRICGVFGNSKYAIEWYNLGYVGEPFPIGLPAEVIYMHPDAWKDVTTLLRIPRKDWPK